MKIPFSPSIYEHAAYLIDMSPWDVSHDPELLYQAHRKAYETYRHSPIVVGIDIYNVEAEAYGCIIDNPGGNGIPAITQGIINSVKEVSSLKPFNPEKEGRIGMIVQVGKRLASDFPGADVKIPVSGPFSIASNLRGLTGFLEDVAYFPQHVAEFLDQLVENQIGLCEVIIKAGLDVAFFESAATPPLMSPYQFREIELPALKKAMERVGRAVGHPVPCIIGGNTVPILEDILSTGTEYVICPAQTETDQVEFMKIFGDRKDVNVRINMTPNIVAYGSRDEIFAEVDRILDIADGKPNILLGTGAVPYETPPENIIMIKNYVS
jgi:uroporphyrinogen decarboxylase